MEQRNVSRLTLNVPIATKVVCFARLLKCLRSLYGKQCGPRSNCSYRSSLFWVHAVCFYTLFAKNNRQLFAAEDFSRRHFQMHFFLGALRVKQYFIYRPRLHFVANEQQRYRQTCVRSHKKYNTLSLKASPIKGL